MMLGGEEEISAPFRWRRTTLSSNSDNRLSIHAEHDVDDGVDHRTRLHARAFVPRLVPISTCLDTGMQPLSLN